MKDFAFEPHFKADGSSVSISNFSGADTNAFEVPNLENAPAMLCEKSRSPGEETIFFNTFCNKETNKQERPKSWTCLAAADNGCGTDVDCYKYCNGLLKLAPSCSCPHWNG